MDRTKPRRERSGGISRLQRERNDARFALSARGAPREVRRLAERPRVTTLLLVLDWITDHLALGGCFPIQAAADLARAHAIRRVVDLREEECDDAVALRRHGIVLLHLPTADRCAVAPGPLRRGVEWVRRSLRDSHRVLVHCQHGIGRSALLVLCVLVADGHDPLDAMTLIKDRRPVASPSPEQLQAFRGFIARLRRRGGTDADVPSFEALAQIAYRHLQIDEPPRAEPPSP
jgi:protein-tyrosine phosphatase